MSEAGIPARTVERALIDREHAIRAGIRPTPGIVLVDEAGAIGTRTLARLAEAVALADAKLVLVGDDAQLPAVAAGATYSDLLEQGEPYTRSRRRGASSPRQANPTCRGKSACQAARRHARRSRRLPRAQARTGTSRRSTAEPRSEPPLPGTPSSSGRGRSDTDRPDRAKQCPREPAQPARPRLDARIRTARP